MAAVVNLRGPERQARSFAPLAALAWLLSAVGAPGCAATTERPAPEAPTSAVPEACLEHPRRYAATKPTGPRSFATAHEAFVRGQDLRDAGDIEAARAAFGEAVFADPSHGLAHIALAEAHGLTDNDTARIRVHLATAVILLPENPRAHLLFGNASLESQDLDAARAHWTCALTLSPGLADAHLALARHYLAVKDPESAERHARAALADDPNAYRRHILLAQALEGLGRLEPAADAAARAAELVGRSAALYRRAATLYDRAGVIARATHLREKADEIDPPEAERRLRPLRKARRPKRRSRRRRK